MKVRLLIPTTGLVFFNGIGAYRFTSRAALATWVDAPEISPDPAAAVAVEGEPGGEPGVVEAPRVPATTS